MVRWLVCEGTHVIDWLSRENKLEELRLHRVYHLHASWEKWEQNLRSFVINLTTKCGNPGVASLANILPQGLLDEVSVDADTPSKIQSVRRDDCRSRVDSALEGGIWSSTETFQSVRS